MVEKEGRKPKVEEELLKDGFMRPKDIVHYPSGMKRCTMRLKRCRWVSKAGRGRCYYNQYSYTEEGCMATPVGMTVFTCQTLILNHAPLGTLLSFLSDSQCTTLGCRSMWIVGDPPAWSCRRTQMWLLERANHTPPCLLRSLSLGANLQRRQGVGSLGRWGRKTP